MRSCQLVTATIAVLSTLAGRAEAQRVHEVRVEAISAREIYRFVPQVVRARPGDVLLFKATRGTPHSIVFDAAGLPGPAREALNGAMSRRTGDLSSPLLTPDGAEYRMVVPPLREGRYAFFCLPHRAYDMRGVLVVSK